MECTFHVDAIANAAARPLSESYNANGNGFSCVGRLHFVAFSPSRQKRAIGEQAYANAPGCTGAIRVTVHIRRKR